MKSFVEATTPSSADDEERNRASQDGNLEVVVLHGFPEPALEQTWRRLLSAVKTPSHYTAPEFFLEPYFDQRHPFAILVLNNAAAVGVLTGFHSGQEVCCGLPTRPQIQLHPQSDPKAVIGAMARGLESESRNAELISIYSWEWLPLDPIIKFGYKRRDLEGVPVLDLGAGPEALLKNCGRKKSEIRSAINHGVEVFPADTPQDYEAFYDIYSAWCRSKGTDCYSREIEDLVFRTTSSNRRLLLARHSGKIIAGSVFRFFPGGLVEYSRNSSLQDYQNLRPNQLLIWRGIEWGCEQGFSAFSMNASHRFLREFGGRMIPIHRYRLDRTLLRRHDWREKLLDASRKALGKLPPAWEKRVRRILGKEIPLGW